MKKYQRLYRYFYEVPKHGYFKIETHQRVDPLAPDRYLIKCFKGNWGIWRKKSEDGYHELEEATKALEDLMFRFKKMNGLKVKELPE